MTSLLLQRQRDTVGDLEHADVHPALPKLSITRRNLALQVQLGRNVRKHFGLCMLTAKAQPEGNSTQTAHQPRQGSCKLSALPRTARRGSIDEQLLSQQGPVCPQYAIGDTSQHIHPVPSLHQMGEISAHLSSLKILSLIALIACTRKPTTLRSCMEVPQAFPKCLCCASHIAREEVSLQLETIQWMQIKPCKCAPRPPCKKQCMHGPYVAADMGLIGPIK